MSRKELRPHSIKFDRIVLELGSVMINELNDPLGLENMSTGGYSKTAITRPSMPRFQQR